MIGSRGISTRSVEIPLTLLMLFALAAPAWAEPSLAAELAGERDRIRERREALREALADPADAVATWRAARSAPDPTQVWAALTNLALTADTPAVRAEAALDAAGLALDQGDPAAAWQQARTAFLAAPDLHTTRRAGALLDGLAARDARLARADPHLQTALASARPLWTQSQHKAPSPVVRKRSSASARVSHGVNAFYRTQIRPAIGQRCSLRPSCSEYFHLATARHGWLGVPMLTDRFIREPDHARLRLKPAREGDLEVYLDPLEDHDWWMRND